ncbi:hypothetical protein CYFUS_004645 [Cystobacter fuscus]|uniref:Uncharacterized protein n=1 Tax=Cystobacter fuscus TaxID=43 RepID=A0A250J5K2_9BACT|nr:hypothetical protein [Cystobacter fuscus]ATB39204.1 hypothetical protein CYFUS_004645 [Cystobacter fuscus]
MSDSILQKLSAKLVKSEEKDQGALDAALDERLGDSLDEYLDIIAAGANHSSYHQNNHSSS